MSKCVFNTNTKRLNYIFFFSLLKWKRKSVDKVAVQHANVWNKTLFETNILEPIENFDGVAIWPLHWVLELNPINQVQQKLKKNLVELRDFAQKLVISFFL